MVRATGVPAVGTATASAEPSYRPTRLDSLTGLRWLAALAVFFTHLEVLAPSLVTLTWVGGCGVALFFALSGFVLAWSAPAVDTARSFYRRRVARIYPLYAVSLGLSLVVHQVWGGGAWTSCLVLVAALLMVQGWFPGTPAVFFGVSTPAWSLSHEAFFYAVFPASRRISAPGTRGWLAVAVGAAVWPWLVVVAVVVTGRFEVGDAWTELLLRSPLGTIPCFVLGLALARAMRLGWRPRASVRLAVAAVAVSVAAMMAVVTVAGDVPALQWYLLFPVTTPAFGLLLATLAAADLDGRPTGLRSRRMLALGEWSYAFYLVHLSALVAVAGIVGAGRGVLVTLAEVGLALGLAVAVSAALYHLVERPLERVLRGTGSERLSVPTRGRAGSSR